LSPVFRHGSLRLYLLRLLDEEPRHGYEVIRLLRDRFMGVYSPSPGTIYPRLARLEEEGLVTHDEVDGRKVYRITEAGREELRSRSDELDELEEELSESVSDIVREVREDVRQTVRSLREELTRAARESRQARDEAWEQARQTRDEAREHARQTREDAREQARQARDDAKVAARQANEDAKEQVRQAKEQAKQAQDEAKQAYQDAKERAKQGQDPWGQATDDETDQPDPQTAAARGRAETVGQDTARRVREQARRLREEAQRIHEGAGAGAGAGAAFSGEDQDWDTPPGWTGKPSWTEWPGRRGWEDWTRTRGRRGWTGSLDFGTLKDLERVAVQFTADLRKLAMQSGVVGENVISDLRTILEEALERIKSEIFGPEQGTPADPEAAVPETTAQSSDDEGQDS
jgi:DNA-binding PadR family transcriptional regulator